MSVKQAIKTILINVRNRKKNVKIKTSATISLRSVFEGNNRIGSHGTFHGHLGRFSYLGDRCRLSATIGRYCSIDSDVSCAMGKHPTSDWVSTHPAFFSIRKQAGISYVQEEKFQEIVYANKENATVVSIGNDVWIGNGVQLMPGIHIDDGAVIAAGAVVTKDVAPYDIVAGVPARSLRKRFSPQQIEALLSLKWWDKSENWIKGHVNDFSHIDTFLTSIAQDHKEAEV